MQAYRNDTKCWEIQGHRYIVFSGGPARPITGHASEAPKPEGRGTPTIVRSCDLGIAGFRRNANNQVNLPYSIVKGRKYPTSFMHNDNSRRKTEQEKICKGKIMINKIRDSIKQVLHSLDVGGEQFRRLVERGQNLKDTCKTKTRSLPLRFGVYAPLGRDFFLPLTTIPTIISPAKVVFIK